MKRAAFGVVLLLLSVACGSTSKTATTADTTVQATAPADGSSSESGSSPGATSRTGKTQASTGTAGPGAASTNPGPGTASAPSVAGGLRSGPIEIGFLNTRVSNAEALGGNNGESQPPADVFRALVKATNARGGFAGRQIVPVVADTDTATSRWETDYQAACESFTQDHHVSAVLGYSFTMLDSFESCLTKAGVVHLHGGYNVGDVKTLADYASMFATANPTVDRRYEIQLSSAVDDGFLTPSHRLGLILDDCPPDWRAYNRTVVPYVKDAHLNVVAKQVLSCPDGATDISPLVSQLNNAVLQFRSKDVDRVFIDGIPFILFASAAEGQGWAPGYLLTSATGGAVLEANPVPERQLEHIHSAGWLPFLDVSKSKQPPLTAPQQRCLSLLKSVGIIPSQYNDFLAAYTTCDAFFLYERALTATRGVSRAEAVRGAIEALRGTYPSTTAHGAKSIYGPGDHDAASVYRPWTWKKDCECFLYTGRPRPLP